MAPSRNSSILCEIKLLYFHFPAATFLLISILWPCFCVSEHRDFSVDASSVTGPQLASPLLCRLTLLLSLLFAVMSYRFVFLSWIWNSWVRVGLKKKSFRYTLLNSLPDTVTHPPTACEHVCPPPVWQPWELWDLDAISSIDGAA